MEAASIPAHGHDEHHHHGPPEANRSSRVTPATLGMLLFIMSEIMIFGAFFTAYSSSSGSWPWGHHWFPFDGAQGQQLEAAQGRRGHEHLHPAELVADPALGADVDQERQTASA